MSGDKHFGLILRWEKLAIAFLPTLLQISAGSANHRQRRDFSNVEVLHQDHGSPEASARGQRRRGVIRVHYCRGLHHRRSGCCVRYWYWWCNRDGADWRDHRYHRCFHCGRVIQASRPRGGHRNLPPTFLRHAFMNWIAPTASFLKVLPSGLRRILPILRYRVKSTDALKRLRTDKGGVVSFEYVMVAACVVASVSAAFGTNAGGGVATALTSAISTISAAINTVVGS